MKKRERLYVFTVVMVICRIFLFYSVTNVVSNEEFNENITALASLNAKDNYYTYNSNRYIIIARVNAARVEEEVAKKDVWSVISLFFTFFTLMGSLISVKYLGGKNLKYEFWNDNWQLIAIIIGFLSYMIFLSGNNMNNSVILFNNSTIILGIIFFIQVLIFLIGVWELNKKRA